MKRYRFYFLAACLLLVVLTSCRKEENLQLSEQVQVGVDPDPEADVVGMYILNSGGKGNNETTLDYFDFTTGVYHRNIFAERNPETIPVLGDNGTSIAVHDGRLYVVLNNSHRVVILDAYTTRMLGEIPVNDCRHIAFDRSSGYISSYLKPQKTDVHPPLGEVVRFSLSSFEITGRVTVGFQPEALMVLDTVLVVANSGVYNKPQMDNRVSTVDLDDFSQIAHTKVCISPNQMLLGSKDYLWISSRGDFRANPPKLYLLKRFDNNSYFDVTDSLDVPCFAMSTFKDSIYVLSGQIKENGRVQDVRYRKLSMLSHDEADPFLSNEQETEIQSPNGLAIHPINGDIYVLDAKNYTSSGMLFCYSHSGEKKWSVRTGIQPNNVAFVWKK